MSDYITSTYRTPQQIVAAAREAHESHQKQLAEQKSDGLPDHEDDAPTMDDIILSTSKTSQQIIAEARETYHRLKALESQQPNETDSPDNQKSDALSQTEEDTSDSDK